MVYFELRFRLAVWAVSLSVCFAVVLSLVVFGFYLPQEPYFVPLNQRVNNAVALAVVIAFVFPTVVELNNFRWKKAVDTNVPRLLRDITESVRSGLTLPRALEEASQRDYGPISKELERAVSMFILGARFEESLMFLAKRLRRPSALRLCTVFVEANQTGGKLLEVLSTSVDLFTSLEEYHEEQYTSMRPYMMTVYMATLTFLVIAYIMVHQFLAPLYAASAGAGAKESGLLGGVLDIRYYASLLFWASMLESIFGGLVVGKIVDRNLAAGLLHSVILMAITLAFFNVSGV